MTEQNILDDMEVIEWCYQGNSDSNEEEKKWGNDILKKYCNYPQNKVISQWTTKLCEEVVREALIRLDYKNVRRTKGIESSFGRKKYCPDWETDKYIIEVKGRSWTTSGTAGEKILGVPLKYAEIPKLTGKKLKIVLVGYQEYEGKNCFAFGNISNSKECNEQARLMLDFYKYTMGFEYVCFTDLLKEIGYEDGCWLE